MSVIDEVLLTRTPQPAFPVLNSIQKRFSPRVFCMDPIPEDDLKTIFEAARWAPSGRNHQPWKFWWARNGSLGYEKIAAALPERNYWAKSAPVLIVACFDPTEPKDGRNKWAEYDLGAAVMSLVLQAQELGYYCRQIGSFDCEKAKHILEIADPFQPMAIIAMGKMGKESDYANANNEFVQKDLAANPRKDKIDIELK